MALINLVNDCIKEYGKQDVEKCKQQIITDAQIEINLIYNNPYFNDGEKFYRAQRVKQIADDLLARQCKRDAFLDAAGFLNELSKIFDHSSK